MRSIQMESVLEERKEKLIREHMLVSEFIGFAITTPIAETLVWDGKCNFPFINDTGVIFSNVANFLRPEDFRSFRGKENNILESRIDIAQQRLGKHLHRIQKQAVTLIGRSADVVDILPEPIPLRANVVQLRKFPLAKYEEFHINWREYDESIIAITHTLERHRNPDFWIPLHDYIPDKASRFTYAFTGSKALTHWFINWFGNIDSPTDGSPEE
jgi:hypothetical protein